MSDGLDFQTLFNALHLAVFVYPLDEEGPGTFAEVNDAALRRYGYSREEFLELSPLDITHEADKGSDGEVRRLLKRDRHLVFDATHLTREGEKVPGLIDARVVDLNGRQVVLAVVQDLHEQSLHEQRRTQNTLRSIQAAVGAKLGSEFFDSVVKHLSRTLGADIAFVGEMVGEERDRVRTLSVHADGAPSEPLEYSLEGTPCDEMSRSGPRAYPSGVAERFPRDPVLAEKGIEGYVGMPLRDSSGTLIGVLVALFRRPLEAPGEAETLLEIFAARTAAELERLGRHERMQSLEKAVESSGEAIFMTDVEGIFTYVNPEFTRMYGFTPEELVGRKTPRVLKSGLLDDEVYEEFWETILRGEAVNGRLINRTRDGSFLAVESSSNPIFGEDGEILGFLAIQRDITDQEGAEQALRESEGRLRSIFRAAPVGIGAVRDRVLVEVNDLVCEMVGRSREELLGESARILYPTDEDFEFVGREKYRQIGTRGTGTVETRWQCKDGGILDVLLSSTPIVQNDLSKGVTFTALDITDRKRAEEALRDSERRFRSVIEQSNDAIYILYNGHFDLVNQRFCELTGVSREAAGEPDFSFWNLVAPESMGLIEERQRRRDAGDEIPGLYDFAILRPDGTRVQVEASVREIDYRGGRAVLGLLRDVSEQHELEDRLRQAQKMESLGRLSGGVAHDLNNLLTPILGYGDMLLEDFGPDDRRREFAEQVVEAGNRSRDLVRQLLAFSRRQTLEFRHVDLNELVLNFQKLLRRAVREDIELEIKLAPDLPPIRADIVQIEQVIMNLAVNAQDAMPDGGKLTIETLLKGASDLEGSEKSLADAEAVVSMTVADTGKGMDDATLKQVFEPFFTTKKRGTGLGLATVYGIVKQHDGNIQVESEPGQGTVFRCEFPVSEGVPEREVGSPGPTVEEADGGATILVVEDETGVRNLAVDLLKQRGYDVLSAESGRACLELVRDHPGSIDLLLTDVVLPGMDGRTLSKELTARFPTLKTLYMSGYTADVITHHGVLEEGIHFIQKPFSVRQLLQKLNEALAD